MLAVGAGYVTEKSWESCDTEAKIYDCVIKITLLASQKVEFL
jgi:hypothetical protein